MYPPPPPPPPWYQPQRQRPIPPLPPPTQRHYVINPPPPPPERTYPLHTPSVNIPQSHAIQFPPPPQQQPCLPLQRELCSEFCLNNNSSSNHGLVSTTASSKAIACPDVSEVGVPTRDNLDVAKFLVSNAKMLSSSNEELFAKSVECVLNPVYTLFDRDNKKGYSGGTTNDDLMPGCGSSSTGEGMPFGGSFASLISDMPAPTKQKDGQQHGSTEVSGTGSKAGDDVEFCENDTLNEALSGVCGKTSDAVIAIEGRSMRYPFNSKITICFFYISHSHII